MHEMPLLLERELDRHDKALALLGRTQRRARSSVLLSRTVHEWVSVIAHERVLLRSSSMLVRRQRTALMHQTMGKWKVAVSHDLEEEEKRDLVGVAQSIDDMTQSIEDITQRTLGDIDAACLERDLRSQSKHAPSEAEVDSEIVLALRSELLEVASSTALPDPLPLQPSFDNASDASPAVSNSAPRPSESGSALNIIPPVHKDAQTQSEDSMRSLSDIGVSLRRAAFDDECNASSISVVNSEPWTTSAFSTPLRGAHHHQDQQPGKPESHLDHHSASTVHVDLESSRSTRLVDAQTSPPASFVATAHPNFTVSSSSSSYSIKQLKSARRVATEVARSHMARALHAYKSEVARRAERRELAERAMGKRREERVGWWFDSWLAMHRSGEELGQREQECQDQRTRAVREREEEGAKLARHVSTTRFFASLIVML